MFHRLAIAVAAMTLAAAASAQSTPRIDQRQPNQAGRIEQGVATGTLTRREAARLQAGQQHVQRMENRAGADGALTVGERARIEHAQDAQSRRIYRQKHDPQRVPGGEGRPRGAR